MEEQEMVYFCRAGTLAKIGRSYCVARRIKQLQTGCGETIVLLGSIVGGPRVERQIHKQWHHLRVGGEWFRYTPELAAFIDHKLHPGRHDPEARQCMAEATAWVRTYFPG